MTAMHRLRRAMAAAPFVLVLVFTSFGAAIASPSQNSPAVVSHALPGQIASIDPPVPPAAGQPCVVELLHDRAWPQMFVSASTDPAISYTPPAACPPPWSKVILKADIQSSRRSVVETLGMDLNNVRLFRGAVPRYNGVSSWHIERDLTDYSALFKTPQSGLIWSTQNALENDYTDSFAFSGSAKLLFYPSTAATPAPRVPDAVIAVNQPSPVDLPHNIVRAYLDVEADYQNGSYDVSGNGNPFWYSCYSDDPASLPLGDAIASIYGLGGAPMVHIFPPKQGCSGGSFREVKVGVDGVPAGIAPAFPLIVADLSWLERNSADQPITTLEMLNFKPYRIDLTPFAAVLSAAGPHDVTADNIAPGEDDSSNGGTALLLYLDPHSSQVTGAVTTNTLATENGTPTDVNTLQQTGGIIDGDIKTKQQRDFEIRGFVMTSLGRIDSCVHQVSHFNSTQAFHLESNPLHLDVPTDELYSQKIQLMSTVQQTSHRWIGGVLLNKDQTTVHYPLELTYHIKGQSDNDGDTQTDQVLLGHVAVAEQRVVDGDHYQPGLGHFITHAESGFHSVRINGTDDPNPVWESATTRGYNDNFGSCYRAEMTSGNGAITGTTQGQGCPGNHDWVIWFARPDGSSGAFDW